MARPKLQKFSDFAARLLPHETEYLLSIQQFQDDKKLAILRQMDENCRKIANQTAYDEELDKRKYSNLKQWITERLDEIDVDAYLEWIHRLDLQILTDTITPEAEKELLRQIDKVDATHFYFVKFYELVNDFRHFLLIRLRFSEHALADAFIRDKLEAYHKAREISERIHSATLDITDQYAQEKTDSREWESWLTQVFQDEQIDGYNRYMALIRLTFMYFNYRQFEVLRQAYDLLDQWFRSGKYYSKRLLLNYYSNRLLLHSKFDEYEKAAYYGHLSIREKNSDYIHYVNNLAAVLLREQKAEEALLIMREAFSEAKSTKNMHSRVGYVAFYTKCLIATKQYKSAEQYAETFLKVYKKEIFKYRWHIFFSAYLESLLFQQKYDKILSVIRKYKLADRDKKYTEKAIYLPTIPWYAAIAEFKESRNGLDKLAQRMLKDTELLLQNPDKARPLEELLDDLRPLIPDVFNRIFATAKEAEIKNLYR